MLTGWLTDWCLVTPDVIYEQYKKGTKIFCNQMKNNSRWNSACLLWLYVTDMPMQWTNWMVQRRLGHARLPRCEGQPIMCATTLWGVVVHQPPIHLSIIPYCCLLLTSINIYLYRAKSRLKALYNQKKPNHSSGSDGSSSSLFQSKLLRRCQLVLQNSRSPKGNYRKSHLECQRPSISLFFTQILPPPSRLQRKVSELDLAHETHKREEGNGLFASRSCRRTFWYIWCSGRTTPAPGSLLCGKVRPAGGPPLQTSSHFPRLLRNTHARTRAYTTMHTIRRNTNTRMCTL